MNKEIKFRAWDKNRKSMIDWFTMSQSTWNKGVTTLMYDILVSNKMNFDLMEYTGLKDKNGKEIYEGDICRCVYKNSEGGGYYSLEKEKGVVQYSAQWGYRFELKNGQQRLISLSSIQFDTFEIIGNIYENPELLK